MVICLLQYRKDFVVRARCYRENAKALRHADMIGIGEYRELQNLSDAPPDADRREVFIGLTVSPQHDAGAQGKPPASSGSVKVFVHLKITGPNRDRGRETPPRERREAQAEKAV